MDNIGETLDRDGLVVLREALADSDIERLRTIVDAASAAHGDEVATTAVDEVQSVYGIHRTFADSPAILRRCRGFESARQHIGENPYIFQSQLHLKPLSSPRLDWHQDYNAFHRKDGLPLSRGCAMILFADQATTSNGAMFMIPGSHREGIIQSELSDSGVRAGHVEAGGRAAQNFTVTPRTATALAHRLGTIALEGGPGDVALMDLHLVHASGPSLLERRRALIHFSLVGASVRVSPAHAGNRPRYLADVDGDVI